MSSYRDGRYGPRFGPDWTDCLADAVYVDDEPACLECEDTGKIRTRAGTVTIEIPCPECPAGDE